MSVRMRWEEQYFLETAPVAVTCPTVRRPRTLESAAALMLCALIAAGICATVRAAIGDGSAPMLTLSRSIAGVGPLALMGASAERRLGYVTVVGDVTSNSVTPLSGVEATVELVDKAGATVRYEAGMIAFDSIRPGESSPFKVTLQDDPRAVSYCVHFKELLGRRLD